MSKWQISDNFIGMLVIAFMLALFGVAMLPSLATSGKPRGNRAAILECRDYFFMANRIETNSPSFDFFSLSNDDKQEVVSEFSHWNFWIKTNFVWRSDNSEREIVIVCGQEFDNVHKPGFWNSFFRNPAHAVGYSDKTVGLISPEEFNNLNLRGFVSASNLATNSDFDIFK